MDPITLFGIIAGALSVAEITTTVGKGCRHLQQDFSGALEHIELISQYTKSIDLAIQHISSVVEKRPQAFPSSFGTHLGETTSAVYNTIQQIQDHAQSIRTEAATSKSKAKLRHVRKITQVKGPSIDERAASLERTDNKELFEKASSISAKLVKLSDELDHEAQFKKFPFNSILLESKVYRRVCESCWVREVNTEDQKGNENDSAGSVSIMPFSSNSAIASEGDCPVSLDELVSSRQRSGRPVAPPTSEYFDSTTLETSAVHPSEQSGTWSETCPTGSTFATTISSVSTKACLSPVPRANSLASSSMISVVIEGVGTGSTELVIRGAADDFSKTEEAILHVRDRILLARGFNPDHFYGVQANVTIEAMGQSGVYRMPLDPEDLNNAVQKLKNGFYCFFDILAHFPSIGQSNGTAFDHYCDPASVSTTESTTQSDTTNLSQLALSSAIGPPHFRFPSRHIPPFIESPTLGHPAEGGFSQVFKATCTEADWVRSWGHRSSAVTDRVPTFFAVKRLHSHNEAEFRKEVEMLKTFGHRPHQHLIKLHASYEWRGNYHLVFPWADGNLIDYWKSHPASAILSQSDAMMNANWFSKHCLGLAEALHLIHFPSDNLIHHGAESASASPCSVMAGNNGCSSSGGLFGRHGDLKPDNILCFKSHGNPWNGVGRDVLKISDFGLAEFTNPGRHDYQAGPQRRGGTETYGAPELRYHSLGHRLTSAYDIWSLGCVFLEFSCWLIGGMEEVQTFKKSRYKVARLGTFFEVKGGEIARSSAVSRQFQKLRHEILKLDPPLPETLSRFFDVIESCFEIDESKRPSAAVTASKMLAIHASLSAG